MIDMLVTSLNARNRYVDMALRLSGAWKMNKNYLAFSSKPDYVTKWKKLYPEAPKFIGAVATNDFTPTIAPTWTIDAYKDKYAVLFKMADVTTAITDYALNKLDDVAYEIRKITANTATKLTVEGNITSGITDVIIVDSLYWTIANLKDYGLTDTSAIIEDNHRDSGGYKNSQLGIKDGDITGVNGSYFIGLHTHFQMQISKDSGKSVDLRAGASDMQDETIFFGTYLLNEFNKTGGEDGSAITQYSGNFILVGEPTKKYVQTEGVKPTL